MDIEKVPEISRERGHEAVQRLINSHFHNDNRARCSIPADRKNDDDLVAMDYLVQCENRISQLQARVETAEGEVKKLTVTPEQLSEKLDHGRNCAAWLSEVDGRTVNREDCTCGYYWRVQLQPSGSCAEEGSKAS